MSAFIQSAFYSRRGKSQAGKELDNSSPDGVEIVEFDVSGERVGELVLKIVKYGDPRLERPSEPVTEFNSHLKKLVEDMFETMYAAKGVGLAAPQIGVNKRIFVMDCTNGQDPTQKYVMINPEILLAEGEVVIEEGCLSLPGIYSKVARPRRVIARGYDMNRNEYTLEATELAARCISHEIDHLNGKLFIAHLSAIKRDLIERKVKKLMRAGQW